jgi:DNA-binding MarR family transcriptional regulator
VVVTARSRWRHLAWLYPLATTADVISTGNHFVLDCVAGALLVTVMLWLTGPIDGQSVGSPTVSTSPARVRSRRQTDLIAVTDPVNARLEIRRREHREVPMGFRRRPTDAHRWPDAGSSRNPDSPPPIWCRHKRRPRSDTPEGYRPVTTDAALAARLRISLARLNRLARNAQHQKELSASQLSVLVAIESHPRVRIGDVAVEQALAAPSATRIVASLVERNLVERLTDPADRRACLIKLTDAGHAALAEIRADATDLIAERLAVLNSADRELLHNAIGSLERLAGIS